MTQGELAEWLGVGKTAIANAELYGKGLGKRNWYRLASLFGTDPRYLEGFEILPSASPDA